MDILILSIDPKPLNNTLEKYEYRIIECADPIDVDYLSTLSVHFAISYRYRHIIKKPVIEYLNGNIINLHISLLPWNRGADPNFWSFLEDTPKGVTIHYIDEGVDTGDTIAQKEIFFNPTGETLATTYDKLNAEIIELFKAVWPLLMTGKAARSKQPQGGSSHSTRDKKRFEHLLQDKGWDTPVEVLTGRALIKPGKEETIR